MSCWSSRCDLADHIMMEKMYEKNGRYESDEFECFEIFKKRTKGVIYKNVKTKLTPYNIRVEAEKNQFLTVIDHKEVVEDKRYRDGKKEKNWFTIKYFNNEYREDQLEEIDYWTTVPIKFTSILDLIPYYPYVIATAASGPNGEHIVLSSRSYVDEMEARHLEFGHSLEVVNFYREELQKHYIEVVNRLNKGE